MKLITKEIERTAPPLGATDGQGDNAKIVAKFFNPCGVGTWLMTEYDPDTRMAFGWCDLGEPELGYFSITELESLRVPFGLGIERDLHFRNKILADVK